MDVNQRIRTGLGGFDEVIDHLRLGDNVVWQVNGMEDYQQVAASYVRQAKKDGRTVVYVRYGSHPPLLGDETGVKRVDMDPTQGFESFASSVSSLFYREGRRVFYLFDCLTDLQTSWRSDLMIGNFFKITCPVLYQLETIAYFAMIRNAHTNHTIAGIRETTQLLLDLYRVKENRYIHPLKVWQRHSPTMFFPHLIEGETAVCITASGQAAELFSSISRGGEIIDYWDQVFRKARKWLDQPREHQEETRKKLISMMLGKEARMTDLCRRYFTLEDLLQIASREVGTGFIGGKSVGMLIARKIIQTESPDHLTPLLEPHDSYYLGADLFYTYIIENGWWELRQKQKTKEGFSRYAPELREKMRHGRFPENVREKFIQMLEYYGQSPIIVRSSSLLEDNFGNAFAGKYDSVFCVNQGTPEERYQAFEQAVREVYASTMNEDAIAYRVNRGLAEKEEQMAILVQRVSGDYYGDCFFPHGAGVGNSSNLYVWDRSIDMTAGMLRLVFGLGTRAVDRTEGDYARLVPLDQPLRMPLNQEADRKKFSQHQVDVLSLTENRLATRPMETMAEYDVKVDRELFFSPDKGAMERSRETGGSVMRNPWLLDSTEMLKKTGFPGYMKEVLALVSGVYQYPVDMEFTVNFTPDYRFRVNVLQCRPLQTTGLGKTVTMPEVVDYRRCYFMSRGNFMGGNVRIPIDWVVMVCPEAYHRLPARSKYETARVVGRLNQALKGKSAMLVGPGRWGTSTPSLGVPVHFTELCHMAAICEVASSEGGFIPELSYGSHFFQDLVETGIFYTALFPEEKTVEYWPERMLERENCLEEIIPRQSLPAGVIHVVRTSGLELFSDIVTQQVVCVFHSLDKG